MQISILLKSLSYYVFANIIVRVLSLIIPLIAIKQLTEMDYHSLLLSIATSNLIISSFGFSLGITSNKCASHLYEDNDSAKINNSLSFFSEIKLYLTSILLIFIALYAFREYLFVNEYKSSMFYIITMINSIIGVTSMVLVNFFIGKNKVNEISTLQTVFGAISILLLIIVVAFDICADSSITYFILLSLPFSLFIFYVFVIKVDAIKHVFIFNPVRRNYIYFNKLVIPSFFSNFIYAFSIWFVLILIGNYSGSLLASKYVTAMLFVNLAMYVPQLSSAVTVRLLIKTTEKRELKSLLYKILILNVFVSSSFLLVVYVFSDFIDVYFSDKFENISELILLLMLAIIPISICNVFGQFLIKIEKLHMGLLFNFIWGLSYISLISFSLVYNSFSIAIPFIASYMILLIFQGIYVKYEFTSLK
jgi:O-antigen/teichoic acid export membrane protein